LDGGTKNVWVFDLRQVAALVDDLQTGIRQV
jgi:hypothetical protein